VRVAATYQIKSDRDGAKYMTGLARMQGIIIFAPLRLCVDQRPFFLAKAQRRKGLLDILQFREGG
jgi:hypothetical protein